MHISGSKAKADLKEHQQILTDLFYYFWGRDIQIMLEDPVLMDKEFGVLSLHPAAFMNEEELEVLIAHYGCEQTHGWEEDREDHQMTKLLINAARKCPV